MSSPSEQLTKTDNAANLDRPYLGQLASGEPVYDRPNSHAHLSGELLTQALGRIDSHGRNFVDDEVQFNHTVGDCLCVETTDEDEIVYATRPHRRGPTRFVLNRRPKPTDKVTVIAFTPKDETGFMLLATAFIGPKSEVEPWDPRATEASVEFWQNHALIWDPTQVVESPLT